MHLIYQKSLNCASMQWRETFMQRVICASTFDHRPRGHSSELYAIVP